TLTAPRSCKLPTWKGSERPTRFVWHGRRPDHREPPRLLCRRGARPPRSRPRPRPRDGTPMTPAWLYDLALCLHLLGAFSLVSGTVVAGAGFEMARRRTSCAEIALLLGLARIGAVLVVAGTLFAAGFGLWLVDLGHWGYGTPWVDAAIGLLTLVVVIGSIGGQRPKQARKLATS